MTSLSRRSRSPNELEEGNRSAERPLLQNPARSSDDFNLDDDDVINAAEPAVPAATGLTARGVIVGLAIGSLICISNCYFGLQTGWISMMSLPASLMAFGVFKLMGGLLATPFSPIENVLVQTIAVASGTMPLAAGLVGVVPALERLLRADEDGPLDLSLTKLIVWSLGVAFFGVFFAIPLRKQVLIREQLRFPSGTATAEMITILHQDPSKRAAGVQHVEYATKIKVLAWAFSLSAIITIITFLLPGLKHLAIFDWCTFGRFHLKDDWLISFQPSLAYVGQGMIMGIHTTSSMLFGAVLGWAVLSPIARSYGWAPGPVADHATGARGWLIWISLAIMLTDSIISLGVVLTRWLLTRKNDQRSIDEAELDAPSSMLVPTRWIWVGLAGSALLCIFAIVYAFDGVVPVYTIVCSILLALFLSVLGVRALGETDLNPVSGIGKISQLIFALIVKQGSPYAVVINLVAGGVAEAGAQQAGDLMQDLKTGHLLGASPRVQTYGQLIGSAYSAVLSAAVYKLYMNLYTIPGDLFAIPTAFQWIDCSRLVNGHGLPPKVGIFALVMSLIFAGVTLVRSLHSAHTDLLPSGLAAAVGMYNTMDFTLARFIGGLSSWWWHRRCTSRQEPEKRILVTILASGFILGEGVLGSVFMLLYSLVVR
ncbi:OPT super [Savitreella phatthalungensis]